MPTAADARPITFFVPALKRHETSELPASDHPELMAVSITGASCALSCDHCRGSILRRMPAALTPHDLYEIGVRHAGRGGRGLLVTGGADARGSVPLNPHSQVMGRLKSELGLSVVVHSGLVDRQLAQSLRAATVDRVMLDVIGCDDTIQQVCHLNASPEDYYRSVDLLVEADLQVVPHVVIGLHYGQIREERACLQRLARLPLSALVLVVLSFTEGTPMDGISPPSVSDVAQLLREARSLFADIPLILGCARPAGRYRHQLDREAVLAGLDGIAFPSDGIVAFSRSNGRQPLVSRLCCSMERGC